MSIIFILLGLLALLWFFGAGFLTQKKISLFILLCIDIHIRFQTTR